MIEVIGKAAMLEMLAEECAELSQSALKYARILRGDNPTPVTEDEAKEHIREEYTDVLLVAAELGLQYDKDIADTKSRRWHERMSI